MRLLTALHNLLLPPRCAMTGAAVDQVGALSPAAWASLRFIAAPQCCICGYPFDFAVEGATYCASCLARPPPYASARAALLYDDASRGLILKFKHADRLDAVVTLAGWLERAGREMLEACDVIVPVPLHRWRLLRRRYNQAAVLALALARNRSRPCLPDGLRRLRHTPTQGTMGFRERQRNVRNVFAVTARHRAALAGKVVVLVDDVHTSGATIHECTKALLKGGASAVHVLTAARVVRPASLS